MLQLRLVCVCVCSTGGVHHITTLRVLKYLAMRRLTLTHYQHGVAWMRKSDVDQGIAALSQCREEPHSVSIQEPESEPRHVELCGVDGSCAHV